MNYRFDLLKPVAIGSDHAGFEYKSIIIEALQNAGINVIDFGAYTANSADYPDFAHPVALSVKNMECALGILICGSGNGVAITANKYQEIRAAICWKKELAELARKHNNANIICVPSRFVSSNEAIEMSLSFIETSFEGGRHEKRISKITSF